MPRSRIRARRLTARASGNLLLQLAHSPAACRSPSRRTSTDRSGTSPRAAPPGRSHRPHPAAPPTKLPALVRPQIDDRRRQYPELSPVDHQIGAGPHGRRHLAQTSGVGTTRRIRARLQNRDPDARERRDRDDPQIPACRGSARTRAETGAPGWHQRRDRARHQPPQRRLRPRPELRDAASAASRSKNITAAALSAGRPLSA